MASVPHVAGAIRQGPLASDATPRARMSETRPRTRRSAAGRVPPCEIREHLTGVANTVLEEGRRHECHPCPGHDTFDYVLRAVHASGNSEISANVAIEDRRPVQTYQQFFGTAQ